jgi:hypothetical protein
MPFYRFMEKKYVGGLLKGEVRFVRLIRYRLLELAHCDHWIGDKKEGIAETSVNVTFDSAHQTQE